MTLVIVAAVVSTTLLNKGPQTSPDDKVKLVPKLEMELTKFPDHETWVSKLNQTVEYVGMDDPKATLRDVLDQLATLYKVKFDVDESAFQMEMIDGVLIQEVANPKAIPPMQAPLGDVISAILRRIVVRSGARYQIKNNVVEITTTLQLTVTIGATVEAVSLREALDYIEDHFQLKFGPVLMLPGQERAPVKVTAVQGVRLAVILERLLKQVGLLFSVDDVVFQGAMPHP